MKIRTNIALAVVLAVLAAPAAYAGPSANQPARIGAGDFLAGSLHNRERTDASDVVSRYLKNHVQQQDRFITENSASQNRLHRVGVSSYRFITENSASQNRLPSAVVLRSSTPASSNGFRWIAAAIGAAGTLTLTILATAALRGVHRKRRQVAPAS
jgi:hypothetical protein